MDNTEVITYPFNRTISYNGHIKTKIDTIGTTTTETKYTYESPVTRGLKQTQIMVDKANQKITSLVSTTEEIQDDINPIGTCKGVKHADLSGCIESELIWQNSYGDSQQETSTVVKTYLQNKVMRHQKQILLFGIVYLIQPQKVMAGVKYQSTILMEQLLYLQINLQKEIQLTS